MSDKFMQTIPFLFETMYQKASMCDFLWNNDMDVDVITNLRLYDLVRRFYYVKTGQEPTSTRVLELIKFIKSNKNMSDFFMFYCENGLFPDNNTIQLIKY